MNLRFINSLQRAPEPEGTGGDAGFSLADLENDDVPAPKKEEGDDDPDKDDPDKDKGPTPEELEAKRKADEKLALDKAKKEEPKPAETEDESEEEDEPGEDEVAAEEYVAELVALGGETLEVDYGTTDPLSAAGELLRHEAVADATIVKFEEHLEKNYPKAYGFLLHQMAGKPEEEFFGKATDLENLPTVEEVEASVEVQKSIITADLIAKGNSEKHAGLILNQLIADNELEEAAKEALTARSAAQQTKLDAIKADNDKSLKVKEDAITSMNDYVEEVIKTGKIGNIAIPEKDRAPFSKVFKENIRYENGKFVYVTPLNNDNIAKVFGKEFYSYKDGDLGKLVEAAAKTVNANRLKRTIPKDKTPKNGKEDSHRIVTLGEMDAE